MSDHSPAANAFRASRGYLFSVVACAVVLSALALIQYLQGTQRFEPHAVFISATSKSVADVPAWLERDLHSSFLTERALAKARNRLDSAVDVDELPSNGNLRHLLSVAMVPRGPSTGRSIRVGCGHPSDQAPMLLRALAEGFVEERLTQPRANASERTRSAQAAVAANEAEHKAAESSLTQLKRELDRVSASIREQESLVLETGQVIGHGVHSQMAETQRSDGHSERRSELEQSLSDLQTKRDELLGQYTIRHPLIQHVDNRIAEVSAALDKVLSSQVEMRDVPAGNATGALDDAAKVGLAVAKRELQDLQDNLAPLERKYDNQSDRLSRLQDDRRLRNEEASLALAELQRLEEVELQVTEVATSALFDARPLDASGLLFSLALGCLLGFVTFLKSSPVTRRLSSRSEIESILALPVIGLLPGTDDSPDPVAPMELPGFVSRVRLAAELTLAAFLIATAVGTAVLGGYKTRLAAEPLSTAADSLRELTMHFLT